MGWGVGLGWAGGWGWGCVGHGRMGGWGGVDACLGHVGCRSCGAVQLWRCGGQGKKEVSTAMGPCFGPMSSLLSLIFFGHHAAGVEQSAGGRGSGWRGSSGGCRCRVQAVHPRDVRGAIMGGR